MRKGWRRFVETWRKERGISLNVNIGPRTARLRARRRWWMPYFVINGIGIRFGWWGFAITLQPFDYDLFMNRLIAESNECRRQHVAQSPAKDR